MIVRAIAANPALADSFDFFNDYDNTSGWLKQLIRFNRNNGYDEIADQHQKTLDRLTKAYDVWLVEWKKRNA